MRFLRVNSRMAPQDSASRCFLITQVNCRKQRITSPKRDLSSRKPIGRRLYETENSGGNWTRRRREGRGEKLSGENPLRDHSSHKPRIEAGLAENKKAPSVGHMALVYEKLVEQMGVEPTTYTMRTYRSSQLSYCPTLKTILDYTPVSEKSKWNFVIFFTDSAQKTNCSLKT